MQCDLLHSSWTTWLLVLIFSFLSMNDHLFSHPLIYQSWKWITIQTSRCFCPMPPIITQIFNVWTYFIFNRFPLYFLCRNRCDYFFDLIILLKFTNLTMQLLFPTLLLFFKYLGQSSILRGFLSLFVDIITQHSTEVTHVPPDNFPTIFLTSQVTNCCISTMTSGTETGRFILMLKHSMCWLVQVLLFYDWN